MANRILAFMPRPCSCCRELREVEAQLDAAAAVAERIEALASGTLEFWLPSAERILKPKPDDDDEPGIRLLIGLDARTARIDEDLARYTVEELRRIAAALDDAADAIESGVRS